MPHSFVRAASGDARQNQTPRRAAKRRRVSGATENTVEDGAAAAGQAEKGGGSSGRAGEGASPEGWGRLRSERLNDAGSTAHSSKPHTATQGRPCEASEGTDEEFAEPELVFERTTPVEGSAACTYLETQLRPFVQDACSGFTDAQVSDLLRLWDGAQRLEATRYPSRWRLDKGKDGRIHLVKAYSWDSASYEGIFLELIQVKLGDRNYEPPPSLAWGFPSFILRFFEHLGISATHATVHGLNTFAFDSVSYEHKITVNELTRLVTRIVDDLSPQDNSGTRRVDGVFNTAYVADNYGALYAIAPLAPRTIENVMCGRSWAYHVRQILIDIRAIPDIYATGSFPTVLLPSSAERAAARAALDDAKTAGNSVEGWKEASDLHKSRQRKKDAERHAKEKKALEEAARVAAEAEEPTAAEKDVVDADDGPSGRAGEGQSMAPPPVSRRDARVHMPALDGGNDWMNGYDFGLSW